VLTLFPVEHTNALDHAVLGNQLAETPNTGQSNRLGGQSNRLGQEKRRKPRFATSGGTPSGTVRLGCPEIGRPLRTPSTTVETKEERKGSWKSGLEKIR
jgi:hypothetical protein